MTEDEAKTKWCPFVTAEKHYDTKTRTVGNDKCLASGCMAWRRFLGTSINEEFCGGYCGLVPHQ